MRNPTVHDVARKAGVSIATVSRVLNTSGPVSAESAQRVGSQLVCGYVWVNDHGAPRLDLRAPFGGMKQSGIGREQGIEGVRAFQDTHAIATIDPAALAAMAH